MAAQAAIISRQARRAADLVKESLTNPDRREPASDELASLDRSQLRAVESEDDPGDPDDPTAAEPPGPDDDQARAGT